MNSLTEPVSQNSEEDTSLLTEVTDKLHPSSRSAIKKTIKGSVLTGTKVDDSTQPIVPSPALAKDPQQRAVVYLIVKTRKLKSLQD